MGVARDRIKYEVGSENNPGDPFGRSELVIEPTGRARLDQYQRGGAHSVWTGTVASTALDELWKALEDAGFPSVPDHPLPGGSAIRRLTVGTSSGAPYAMVAYHADLAGYRDAFYVLDLVIRQLSQDTVRAVPASDQRIVTETSAVAASAGKELSPGTVFLLAFLPWRRAAHTARVELMDRNASTIDAALRHGIEFSRQALKVEDSMVAETDARFDKLAGEAGFKIPSISSTPIQQWLQALPAYARPHLTSPLLANAWYAGEAARQVAISTAVAAHLAYLRGAAPQNADLREQAGQRAADLKENAAKVEEGLRATNLPLVASHAHSIPKMVKLTRDLEPTTTEGYQQLNELLRDVTSFAESHARQLDVAPPTDVTPPTDEEQALIRKIIADPGNGSLRMNLAKLAERRGDPRATLIRLQLAPAGDSERQKANDIIRSHPDWTARLEALGAKDIKFAGGFPDEITIDAATFLSRGKDLLAAAPITRLHIREAKGKVADIVRSPLLATIEALDLDNQGVVDADVEALAAAPHAARLRQLDLRYNLLSERGIEAIAASQKLKRLEVVTFDGNPTDRVEYYDETNSHMVPTEAGKKLEAKYGPLRWLHR
jgi:hypothetical protein